MTATGTDLEVRTFQSSSDWIRACAFGLGIAVLSLGAHDLAITHLGIPYPYDADVPAWARYVGYVVRLATMVYMCRLASWRLDRMSTAKAVITFGTLVLLSYETFRNMIVDTVITDGWIDYRWASLLMTRLPNVLSAFSTGAIAVFIARRLGKQGMAMNFAVLLLAAAINFYALLPMFKWGADLVQNALNASEIPEIHKPPYGFYIYKYVYSTFIEPTFASFVLAYLLWPRLKGSTLRRTAIFAGLLLLMRGRIVQTGLYSFWSEEPWLLAIAAAGQFLVETLIMASLTGLVWARLSKPVVRTEQVRTPT